jgi:hypothetical protein
MIAVSPDNEDRRRFWSTFAFCAAVALVPIWTVRYLPMVDLPQHAAQISIWKNLHDPRYGFADYFELHYFTPYVAAYGLARIIAEWTSVLVALKVVISLSVLALPLSLVPFFRRMGVSRWWSLVGFSLAYGFSFSWGFLNFMMGVPIAFVYLTVVLGYARAPTVRGGLLVGAFTLALFWVHALLLLFCPAVGGAIIVGRMANVRHVLKRTLPLILPIPIAVAWFLVDRHRSREPLVWDLDVHRVFDLFALSGYCSSFLAAAWIIVTATIVLVRDRHPGEHAGLRWLPLGMTTLVVLLCPSLLFGTTRIGPRFNVFLLPFLIVWLRPSLAPRWRAAVVTATVMLMTMLTVLFWKFDRDARDYQVVQTAIVAPSRIRPLIFFESESDIPFVHFPAWAQAEKGGLYGFSFAASYPVVRYRPGAPRLMAMDTEWRADEFDWRSEAADHYDYYVVRSRISGGVLTEHLFKGAGGSIVLLAEKGMWHVYGARHH